MAEAAPDQAYVGAVAAITSFADGVSSQGEPIVPPFEECKDAATVLAEVKGVAADWINDVYPQLLEVPRTIVAQKDAVASGLATLVSVAQQVEANPGDAQLGEQFSKAAKRLGETVAPRVAEVHQLAAAVAGFAGAVNGGLGEACQRSCAEMGLREAALANQRARDEAVLQSAREAFCPSESEEEAAEAALRSDGESIGQVTAFIEQMQGDVSLTQGAANGLAYATGRWQTLDAQAQAAIATLEKIQSDPVGSLAVDLAAAQQGWAVFAEGLESITEQAAAAAI
jgi:hypothetical protein